MVTTELSAQRMGSIISSRRIIINLVLSANFYLFYWFYLTWKQVKVQTQRDYHPVWHVLALLVPFYNLVVAYRHFKTIRELQAEAGLTPLVNLGLIYTFFIVGGALDYASTEFAEFGVAIEAILLLVGAAFFAGALVSAQRGLNAYFTDIGGESARGARIGVGGVIFVILGLLYWVIVLFP